MFNWTTPEFKPRKWGPFFNSCILYTLLCYWLLTLAFLFMMWRGDGSYTIFFAFFAHFFLCWKKTFDSFFFVNVWQLDNIYYTYNASYISYYIWYNTSRCVFFVHWFYKAHFLWCLNITYSYAKSWLHLALFTHFGIF